VSPHHSCKATRSVTLDRGPYRVLSAGASRTLVFFHGHKEGITGFNDNPVYNTTGRTNLSSLHLRVVAVKASNLIRFSIVTSPLS
jgi:hypothetical protein